MGNNYSRLTQRPLFDWLCVVLLQNMNESCNLILDFGRNGLDLLVINRLAAFLFVYCKRNKMVGQPTQNSGRTQSTEKKNPIAHKCSIKREW